MHPELLIALSRQHKRFDHDASNVNDDATRTRGIAAAVPTRVRRTTGWLLVEAGLRLALDDRKTFDAIRAAASNGQ